MREAKGKRDAKPGDSSTPSDYDRTVDDLRAIEKSLEELNKKYGPEIEKNAEKLIRQYRTGIQSREAARRGARTTRQLQATRRP